MGLKEFIFMSNSKLNDAGRKLEGGTMFCFFFIRRSCENNGGLSLAAFQNAPCSGYTSLRKWYTHRDDKIRLCG
jgi:hypothetical protein